LNWNISKFIIEIMIFYNGEENINNINFELFFKEIKVLIKCNEKVTKFFKNNLLISFNFHHRDKHVIFNKVLKYF